MDVLVVDVDLADGAGETGGAGLARHGQPVAEDDLALDVDPGVGGGHPGTDVDELAADAVRAGARAQGVAIGGIAVASSPRTWSEARSG